ncbi:protein UXT [Procambarus clarkii]|uniref:protein UXT n=1 Tax=Procambarus clarkii TaxID=6728 RepID=UPI0037449C84
MWEEEGWGNEIHGRGFGCGERHVLLCSVDRVRDLLVNSVSELLSTQTQQNRDKLYEDIAAHSQLKQVIDCINEVPHEEGLRTQVDLGSNFYVQSHVPDVSRIYVNVGLGFHLELTLQEALTFIDKKLEILNAKLSESTKKSSKIKGQIKFVCEAIRELQGIPQTKLT